MKAILTHGRPVGAIYDEGRVAGVHMPRLGLEAVKHEPVIAELRCGHAGRTIPVQVTLVVVLKQAVLDTGEARLGNSLGLGLAATLG